MSTPIKSPNRFWMLDGYLTGFGYIPTQAPPEELLLPLPEETSDCPKQPLGWREQLLTLMVIAGLLLTSGWTLTLALYKISTGATLLTQNALSEVHTPTAWKF
jgi:hypothetical protein